jgi:RNA polymerase sigma-70 factor (family 1)
MKPQFVNNKQIVKKLRNGDKKAFESVYWAYREPVYALALNYLKDPELAEDAIQDIFLKLWAKKRDLNDEKSLHGFIFISLKNHVLNMMKLNKRRIIRQFEYLEISSNSKLGTDEVVYHAELEILLQQGLDHLPKKKQEVYRLKQIDGFSNQEIAERMNISVHTVKSQYYKANDFIRKFIETQLNAENR